MAGATPLSKEELSKMLVQEISEKGNQIPEKFILKDGFPEAIDAPPELWADTLLMDFSLLSCSDPHELAKLKSALSNWGCFQLKNHGMDISFLEEFIQLSKQFFPLPLDERLKSSVPGKAFEGYGNDSAYIGNRAGWNDRLLLALLPEEERDLQFWPQNPHNFRGIVEAFARKLEHVLDSIYKAIARSLHLKEDYFLDHMKGGRVTGRLTMYPPCSSPDRVYGSWPHSDGTIITALLAELEGLQIEKDEQWFKVPVMPGALFVNFGDLGEVLTNGIFKSVIHRVVTNSSRDRISWGAFCNPKEDIQIGPASELITANQPPIYKSFNMIEFRQAYIKNLKVGRRAHDALKV